MRRVYCRVSHLVRTACVSQPRLHSLPSVSPRQSRRAAAALYGVLSAVAAAWAALDLELESACPPRRAARAQVEVGRADGARRREEMLSQTKLRTAHS